MSRDLEGMDALPPRSGPPSLDMGVQHVDPLGGEAVAEYEKLQKIKLAAEKLWPAVKFFGLCGASPQYVEAVLELGELLGKLKPAAKQSGGQVAPEAVAGIRKVAVQAVADAIRQSADIRGRVGRSACEDIADIVERMA